jgi:hypothetical protein
MTQFQWYVLLVVAVMVHIAPANPQKVRDRFIGQQLPRPSRCIIAIPGLKIGRASSYYYAMMSDAMSITYAGDLSRDFTRMNCSVIGMEVEAGILDSNGSYSGTAGILQRNEADIVISIFRTDFFEKVIGFTLTHGTPADVTIISRKKDTYKVEVGLIRLWFSSFDSASLWCLIISMFMFLMMFHATQHLIPDTTDGFTPTKAMITKLGNNLYLMFGAFIDQENFNAQNVSGRLLVWAFNVFLLFGLHGIVFGAMGADLVAWIDPPVIESLKEFTPTSYPKPAIIKQYWLLPVLEKSGPKTELYDVKHIIYGNPDECIDAFDPASDITAAPPTLNRTFHYINDSKKAYLLPNDVYERFKPILCDVMPEHAHNLGNSKHLIAPGVFAPVVSRSIDPALRHWYNYKFGTSIETGQRQAGFSVMAKIFTPRFTGKPYAGRTCDISEPHSEPIQAFNLGSYVSSMCACIIMLCISSLILIAEKKSDQLSQNICICKMHVINCTHLVQGIQVRRLWERSVRPMSNRIWFVRASSRVTER